MWWSISGAPVVTPWSAAGRRAPAIAAGCLRIDERIAAGVRPPAVGMKKMGV